MGQKTALITGVAGGIGMATAREYLRQGYRVLGQYRSKPGELDGTVPVRGDFSTPAGVQEFLNNLNQTETSVDVLVNNAGAFHVAGSWMEIMGSGVLDLMQVNLAAPMALIQHVAPFMQERGWGRIVNISSISVEHGGNPASVGYTASKAALEVLTYSWAKTLARDGVLMNALRVGLTDTDFHQRNPGKSMETRVAQVPLGRMATAEEIASTIFFYGSNQNSFATGSIIKVAGGE